MLQQIKSLIIGLLYNNDHDLMCNRYKRSQNFFIIQVLFAQAFAVITGGVFISGFAVHIGASDQLIGYIILIPSISGIFLIFSGPFLECFKSRKKLVMFLTITAKALICLIVAVPLFLKGTAAIIVVFSFLICAYTMLAFSNIAINNWFIGVVPANIRGRYVALRQGFALAVAIIMPFAAGRLMDSVADKYTGFVILFTAGALMIAGEVYAYKHIEEPQCDNMGKGSIKIADVFRIPLKNKEFMHYTIFLLFLNFSLFFSCTFSQVFMVKYLKLSYTFISAIGMLNATLQIFFSRVWGRIGDRYGHEVVMKISIWFYACEIFFWVMLTPRTIMLIPVSSLFSAIANSGFAIGAFNRRYDIIPEKGRTLYDGFYTAVVGVTLLVSPLAGGAAKNAVASIPGIQDKLQFAEFRVLYAFTVITLIVLQLVDMRRSKKAGKQQQLVQKPVDV